MKMTKAIILVLFTFLLVSCSTVEPGHKGVEISFGGKTNMQVVHPEGLQLGLKWLWTDMVEYDVREKTLVQKFEFNDRNNMITTVEIALDYSLDPDRVNLLHTKITDIEIKIVKTLKSACKEVVPQYSAVELNINKRVEAEMLLSKIMAEELPTFYVSFARIQMTDVDIPEKVSQLAEETAVQLGKNELAKEKEDEQLALAKAKVAEAQGNYDAGILNAKTKKLLSTPEILELKKLEVDMEYAKKGISRYGNNNVFGSETAIVKGLK